MTERKKNKANWIMTITALVLGVVALVGACFGLTRNDTTANVTTSMYAVGNINESGKIVESRQSMYMEEMQTTDGYAIELDQETANVTYKVAFYDVDKNFISMTESQDADFDTETNTPETAKYFRVVITPNAVDGEAVELNIFNMHKYAKQISVSYNK